MNTKWDDQRKYFHTWFLLNPLPCSKRKIVYACAVWPDVRIKSCPILIKVCPKSSKSSFYIKNAKFGQIDREMSPILFKRSPIWSHWFAPFASSTFDDDIISSRVSNGAILQTYFRLSLWHCVDIMINFGCRLLWAMLKARSDNYEHYKEAKSFQNFTLLCSSHHCIFAADFD